MSIARLSVVDIGWPGHVPALVPELEQLGYHRYWATEHYAAHQSSSPTVLAGIAAAVTSTIRIGTAGVLINLANPLAVLNDFQLLELLHPGRIDMGVAGATGGPVAERALHSGPPIDRTSYETKLSELARLQRLASWSTGRDERASAIGPRTATQPPMWICGSSVASATVAGHLGTGYAFHDQLCAAGVDGPEVVKAYRSAFKPSVFRSRPETVVACFGTIAATESVTQDRLAERGFARTAFAGTAAQAGEQLEELATRYDVDELAVYEIVQTYETTIATYQSLAGLFALDTAVPAG